MKTIGLIGGMSWESSKVYYELINRRVKELLGGSHSAKTLMISVDFAEIERLTFAGDWKGIGNKMEQASYQLEQGGADFILLCTNTIHMVKDRIEGATSLPFIHIAEAVGEQIKAAGIQKVGLLGTRFTMEMEFYKKVLEEKFGIETLVPDEQGRQTVHDIIYDELVKGVFENSSRMKCAEIIKELEIEGAEGIILGCTELPLLLDSSDASVSMFDTTKIHAYKAVDLALE